MMSELYIDSSELDLLSDIDENLRKELSALEESTDREIQKHLLQIIKIKDFLWT